MDSSAFNTIITEAFKVPLPGIQAHKKLAPANRALTREEVSDIETYKASAVAIICYPMNESIHCILIQRPEYNGSHSGQIAFPGGKFERNDLHLEATARRESFEEIGWSLTPNNYLGQLSELFIPISRFVVTPYLYFCEQPQKLILDPLEVADIIQFPLQLLNEPSILKTMDIQATRGVKLKNVPYFDIQQKVVWGATAIILSELKEMLFHSHSVEF